MSSEDLFYKGKKYLSPIRAKTAEGGRMSSLRRPGKQTTGFQLSGQKPVGRCIVDFSAPKANLVVEEDGAQYQQAKNEKKDKRKDGYLVSRGIEMRRFDTNEVIREIDSVARRICEIVTKRLRAQF